MYCYIKHILSIALAYKLIRFSIFCTVLFFFQLVKRTNWRQQSVIMWVSVGHGKDLRFMCKHVFVFAKTQFTWWENTSGCCWHGFESHRSYFFLSTWNRLRLWRNGFYFWVQRAFKVENYILCFQTAPHEVGHEGEERPSQDQIVNARQMLSAMSIHQQPLAQQLPPVSSTVSPVNFFLPCSMLLEDYEYWRQNQLVYIKLGHSY